jgi:anti-anti-sigma factor
MPPCAIVAQGRSASGRHLASRRPGHERHDDVTVVSLVDEYDISNVEEVLAELGRAVQSGDGVVVSLMQTTFLDSCVVNALFDTNRQLHLRGRELVLHVNTASIVRRVLDISGLAATIARATSIDGAVVTARRVEAPTERTST